MKERVLVVAAHPDDEVLGCGATMAKLSEDNDVFTLILGEGMTSRSPNRDRQIYAKELQTLKENAQAANKVLGVKELFVHDLPDNRFDTVALLDVIKIVEEYKKKIKPTKVFTHNRSDLNIDHRVCFEAVLTAFRPLAGVNEVEILTYEVPSSTEWNYPYSFSPNVFVNIDKFLDKKIEAMNHYCSEKAEFPHPRSDESIIHYAGMRGSQSGFLRAEAFELIRRVIA